MLRRLSTALFCWLFLLGQTPAQDVFVPRELKAIPVVQSEKEIPKAIPVAEPVVAKQPAPAATAKAAPVLPEKVRAAKTEPVKAPAKEPAGSPKSEKVQTVKTETPKGPGPKDPSANPPPDKVQTAKTEPPKAPTVKAPAPGSRPEVKSAKKEPVTEPVVSLNSEKGKTVKAEPAKAPAVKEPVTTPATEKVQTAKVEPIKAPAVKEPAAKAQTVKAEPAKAPPVKEPVTTPATEKVQTAKVEPIKAPAVKEPAAKAQTVKADPVKAPVVKEPAKALPEKIQSVKAETGKAPAKEPPATLPAEKIQLAKIEPAKVTPAQEPMVNVQLSSRSTETASTRLADGFDFPVGKPDAELYYKARGYRVGGHMGEDWDGIRGGDTDFKDPIYCIGDGIVVFARDVRLGWGNVVIVRHAYREGGTVKHIDSLYGHLHNILVRHGQKVARGQQIGTMGTAHGQYDAHLHFEIRKNLEIGMSRSKFQKNFSNYHDPTQFIVAHRQLSGGGANFRVAMNTFTHDSAYRFGEARNFSARKRSTAESSAALKRAVSSATR